MLPWKCAQWGHYSNCKANNCVTKSRDSMTRVPGDAPPSVPHLNSPPTYDLHNHSSPLPVLNSYVNGITLYVFFSPLNSFPQHYVCNTHPHCCLFCHHRYVVFRCVNIPLFVHATVVVLWSCLLWKKHSPSFFWLHKVKSLSREHSKCGIALSKGNFDSSG